MAAEFLKSHGIDLDAELAQIQQKPSSSTTQTNPVTPDPSITQINNVSLPQTSPGSRWDITIHNTRISRITPHSATTTTTTTTTSSGGEHQHQQQSPLPLPLQAHTALLTPSLCHPHIHLDKAYLLSHPAHSHLQLQEGTFPEAMTLTTQAKSHFSPQDLRDRGQRVIDESVEAGVTHMRAFVEVDAGVGRKCLDAGVELKGRAEGKKDGWGRMKVQLCAFAQLPLFSPSEGDEDGAVIRGLMEEAAAAGGGTKGEGEGEADVDVVGSTPYVESERKLMERNVDWMIDLSVRWKKHLDFHLDYHLDAAVEPMVWYVVQKLQEKKWNERNPGKTIVLGHCTRLTVFSPSEWHHLKESIGDLPLAFVGLPNSDMFMMRSSEKTRGTLNVVEMIRQYGLDACLGVNNIGNAFTPQGSCDPLLLAYQGVGVYQAGRERDAEVLLECVSSRARRAIGFDEEGREMGKEKGLELEVKEGDPANLLLFGHEKEEWRTRKSVAEAVYLYDSVKGRIGFLEGVPTSDNNFLS